MRQQADKVGDLWLTTFSGQRGGELGCELLDLGQQIGQVAFHDAPESGIVHGVVPVDETVAESNDPWQFGYLRGNRGFDHGKTVQRLAYNFKFTLNGTAKLPVRFVIAKAAACAPALNAARGLKHIKQQGSGPFAHTPPALFFRLGRENMGSEPLVR